MVAACGAESRIAKKYANFVEETAKHGRLLSPLIGTQLGLVVSQYCLHSLLKLICVVLWTVLELWPCLLVWHKVIS